MCWFCCRKANSPTGFSCVITTAPVDPNDIPNAAYFGTDDVIFYDSNQRGIKFSTGFSYEITDPVKTLILQNGKWYYFYQPV